MKYVGIIVAMPEEQEAVRKLMEHVETKSIYGVGFIKGEIHGINCILTLCGVGKVNAARTTQILINEFDINYVINIGVAGALNYKLKIGDVIIGDTIVQHDFDITAFGHSKGYIPGVGNEVESDRKLVKEFENLIKNVDERTYTVTIGRIATGDIFCTEVAMKDKIAAKFKADCVEMEGAAIAQVCKLCNIPFIIIRSISDFPNGNNAKEHQNNTKLASKRAANILKEFLFNKSESE